MWPDIVAALIVVYLLGFSAILVIEALEAI
jgi:hypothetical protein